MSIDQAIEVLATKRQILVFTGAGISTESGIPDFRGPAGVWTRVDPADFTIDRYLADAEVRARSWAMRSDSGILAAPPNTGHVAVAQLWESGRMLGCVTQNIDGLHAAAGLPDTAIVELHGNAHTTSCVTCGSERSSSDVLARVEAGEPDPRCLDCGGILKVDVVFFGEPMPAAEMTRALSMAAVCDAVIAVGSTLAVYPAAYVPLTAAEAGASLVIVNQGPTDLDDRAEVFVAEPAGEALSAIATALK
jgi:NAD-dependent deacetylase